MEFAKNKTAIIALFLMLSLSASSMLVILPTANAHTPAWNITTYAYVQAEPNPVGVGQPTLVYMWLDQSFNDAYLANDYRFHNYELTITAPNGTVTTQTFAYISDTTSNQGYTFTPTQIGTYTLNFTFPGQAVNTYDHYTGSVFVNDTYMPSTASTTLTVQQTLPAATMSAPLPTAYWTRPIYGENTAWYTIASNWLGTGAQDYNGGFPGDAVGSQTAHIMWTNPLDMGGVAGGNNFLIQGDTFADGSCYLQRYTNPIILDGYLYYTEPVSFTGVPGAGIGPGSFVTPYGPTVCVDLQTGQVIWSRTDVRALSFGFVWDKQDENQHGVYPPMLVSSSGGNINNAGIGVSTGQPVTWSFYDGFTGDWVMNATNIPSGASAMGPNGEYIMYVGENAGTTANPDWRLCEWNSTNLGVWLVNLPIPGQPGTQVGGGAFAGYPDASSSSMYDWNISVPWLNTMTPTPVILKAFYGNMLICMNGTYPSGDDYSLAAPSSSAPYTYFAVNLNASRGAIGSVLWMNTVNAPPGNLTVEFAGADPTANGGSGVFVEYHAETMQYVGYSMATGQKLWGPVGNQDSLSYYNFIGPATTSDCAYGKLYTTGMGGIIYCYDLTNGDLLWSYGNGGEGNSTSSYSVYPGNYPMSIYAIGNGIVYTCTSEHTVETPIYKGALTRAINATTGKEIWSLSNDNNGGSAAMADGFNTFFNAYDNSIYVVGRGPSATTVQAPQTAVTAGTPVAIQGTVVDISPGTKQTEQAADFPNGVPCASDASMTAWMAYVYQQQPEPTNFTGVTVTLTAIDPNNNFITLGKATTDSNGVFGYVWQPPNVPGKYTITATFAGTNGYWGSSDETVMVVQGPAPTAAPTASPPTGLATTSTLELGIVAIAIIIIIIGAVIVLLLLRKRP